MPALRSQSITARQRVYCRRALRTFSTWALALHSLIGCGSSTTSDAGPNTTADAGASTTPDAGPNMTADAGASATPDAGPNMTADAGASTTPDADGPRDVGGEPTSSSPCIVPPRTAGDPELPRRVVDTTWPTVQGRTLTVNGGDDLQDALDMALPGDELVLESGRVFEGNFTLRAHAGTDWILIRSSQMNLLPPTGQRVSPTDRAHMPTLRGASTDPVLTAEPGAHHYRVVGLEMEPRSNGFAYAVVELGNAAETNPSDIQHHFVFDRVYVHAAQGQEARRGFVLNVAHGAVIDSHVSGFFQSGSQSQAILAWHTPGPLRITNNFLSAASEVVMFGGADNASPEFVPQDVEVCRNHFFKPPEFDEDDPGYPGPIDGRHHFESKMSKRVVLSGNYFENNWNKAFGYAVSIKASNQDGGNPWAQSSDYTIAYNVVENSDYGIMLAGRGEGQIAEPNIRLSLVHNLFLDIRNRLFLIGGGFDALRIAHNTFIGENASAAVVFIPDVDPPYGPMSLPADEKMAEFAMNDNIVTGVTYPFIASGMGTSIATMVDVYFEDEPSFIRNVLQAETDGAAEYLLRGIVLTEDLDSLRFRDPSGRDYRLLDDSPYRNTATDGTDVGVDMEALRLATGLEL